MSDVPEDAVSGGPQAGSATADLCNYWSFATAAALAGSAGIRATLPAFLLSLCHQVDPDSYPLSDEASWMGRGEICALMGVLLVVEVLADSIPAVDHALHAILTPAHPAMGGAVAIAPDYCGGMATKVPMALVGASMAYVIHSGKAVTRAASSSASCGACNPFVSHCETVFASILAIMSITHPLAALAALIIFIALGCFGLRALRNAWKGSTEPYVDSDSDSGQNNNNNGESNSNVNNGGGIDRSGLLRPSSLEEPHALAEVGMVANEELKAEAEQEVERIIAAEDAWAILGFGSASTRKHEYQRLVRLLHPDKGLVSGPRAEQALRRVVEANRSLNETIG